MKININSISPLIFPTLIFSPGLRGLGISYYFFLLIGLILTFPLLSSTFNSIFKAKISLLLIIFYLITAIGLMPTISEFQLGEIVLVFSRLFLAIIFIFVVHAHKIKINSTSIAKLYLFTTFIASALIYIQYFTGPLDIFSEAFSSRAGLPRFSTISGSTNIFSVSVAFSILISTYTYKNIKFFKDDTVLLFYQLFITGAALANLSRSGLITSILCLFYARFYLILKNLNPKFFDKLYKIPLRINIPKLKIKLSDILFFALIGIIILGIQNSFLRIIKTLLFFITGNKSLITDYSNATFEARGIGQDYLLRLNWFDERYFNSLVEHPLNIFFGGGSKFFGGTIGLNEAYAHNMYIDILQAQGIFGVLFFTFLLIILLFNSTNTKILKIKFLADIRSFSISVLFLFLATHNSGILFHPLTVFPLLFLQDFLSPKKIFLKDNIMIS